MSLVASVLELLLPTRCAGCDLDDDADLRNGGLCPDCVATIRSAAPLAWSVGAVASALSPPCGGELLRAFAAAPYDGVVRAALLNYKENGRRCLQRELGGCLTVSVLAAARVSQAASRSAAGLLLVPAPSTAAAQRERGHDPVGGMAREVVRRLRAAGLQIGIAAVLRQARAVADQSGLDAAARHANLTGALTVANPASIRGRRVVVDDIVTTGATAIEAARALTAAGALVGAVACVAATPRRYPARASPSGRPFGGLREMQVAG